MEVLATAGGALISASIEALIEKLKSSELLSFAYESELRDELTKWESMLRKIDALLGDAEEKQITDRSVKIWLDELRDLAYDIEDVLDEFSTEALKRRATTEDSSLPTGPSSVFSTFKRKMASKMKGIAKRLRVTMQDETASKMRGLSERLEVITTQEQRLNLKRTAKEGPNKRKERPPTSSLVEESHICGRDDEKEDLVQMLLSHEGSINSFSVIPILGMGGIGKTTLAQLVYNDYKVKAYFEIRVWVCVSENFDVVMLTRRILHEITRKSHEHQTFNSLQENLKEELSQKRFLLILDDVWEKDYSQWDNLCKPFFAGAAGSKIVITTRKKVVASMAGNAPTIDVKRLPDDKCLSLLAIHALDAKNFDSHSNLKEIALDMVKRCKGLPLAAKVLGGFLRNKRSREDWERVQRSETWSLPETSNNTPLAVLKLSYDDLPCQLKRCFVYCAIFPKDYVFDRDELVFLWMAEGFLQFPQRGERMEDLGIHYFDDLVARSLFQSSSEYQERYVMHDLIHDLAQSIGGKIYYNYEKEINSHGEQSNSKPNKVRHASIRLCDDDDLQEYAVLTPKNSLRTILCFPIRNYFTSQEGNAYTERFYDLIIGSKCLRVLSLTSSCITGLPDSIGDLKHLRHLNLSVTKIEQLPESVSSLVNLLTLLLKSCGHLKKLPDKIGNLVNLHCLDISYTPQLREVPSSIGMLINLQTLSKLVVNESHENIIAELKNLNNLRGILSIEGLQNVTNLQDAKSANLKDKQGLEELVFEWKYDCGGDDMSELEDDTSVVEENMSLLVLEALEPPHQNLKGLTIAWYDESEFPSWVSCTSFSKLVSFKLKYCHWIESVPALSNFSVLEDLEILGCDSLKDFGTNFKLPTSLKNLRIVRCKSLLSIIPHGLMILDDNINSHLEDLFIFGCDSLKDFGTNFKLPTSLKKLHIEGCGNLLSLPDGLMMLDDNTNSCLSLLSIWGCGQLTSFPSGKLPTTLESLTIRKCEQMKNLISRVMLSNNMALESIEIGEDNEIRVFPSIDSLQSLENLNIYGCSALESFPNMELPALRYLHIKECQNLSSLPSQMDTHLPSLEGLIVLSCPRLESLTQEEGGLPKNLNSLTIGYCENLRQPMAEWGLHLLSSLRFLNLKGICSVFSDVVSFPEENRCLFPNSLDHLKIEDMNLEFLGLGLRKLTHLHFLTFKKCPKLRYLSKEALPPSLKEVNIWNCSLLKEHYLENEGEYPSSIRFLANEFDDLFFEGRGLAHPANT